MMRLKLHRAPKASFAIWIMLLVFAVCSLLVCAAASLVSARFPPPKIPFGTHLAEVIFVGLVTLLMGICVGWPGARRAIFLFRRRTHRSQLRVRLLDWNLALPTYILLVLAAAGQLLLCFAASPVQLDFATHNFPWMIVATLLSGALAFAAAPGEISRGQGASEIRDGANCKRRPRLTILVALALLVLIIFVAVATFLG